MSKKSSKYGNSYQKPKKTKTEKIWWKIRQNLKNKLKIKKKTEKSVKIFEDFVKMSKNSSKFGNSHKKTKNQKLKKH